MRYTDLTKVKIPKRKIIIDDEEEIKKLYNRIMRLKSTPIITYDQYSKISKVALRGSFTIDHSSNAHGHIDGKGIVIKL